MTQYVCYVHFVMRPKILFTHTTSCLPSGLVGFHEFIDEVAQSCIFH